MRIRRFVGEEFLYVLITAVPFFALIALVWTLPSCSGPDHLKATAQVPAGGVLVKGAGATFPSLLYRQWFATYQSRHPKTVISYDSVGSGEGIRRFIGKEVKEEDKVDFGASDAAMKEEEIAQVP